MTKFDISKRLRSVARRKFGKLAVKYPDGAAGYRRDVRDLNRIADLVKKGASKVALSRLRVLDTAVRDSVPKYIWDFLERGLPEDQRSVWNPRLYKPSKRTLTWASPAKRKKGAKGRKAGSKRFRHGR